MYQTLIKFKSTVDDGVECTTSEFTTMGTIFIENEKVVQIDFLEPLENTDESLETSFFFRENGEIVIQRTGQIQFYQRFLPQTKQQGIYQTAFGQFNMLAETKNILLDSNLKHGKITLDYDLYLNDVKAGYFQLILQYGE
jgi:Uncharacterized protein conserved in bacteria